MLQPAGDRAAGRVPVEQRRLPRPGRAARLRARALPRRRDLDPRGARRRPDPARGSRSSGSETKGSVRLELPETLRPVRRRRLPDPLGQVRALLRADEGRRPRPAADLHPAAAKTRRPGPTWPRGIRSSSSARRGRSSSTRRSPTRPAIARPPAIRRSSSPPRTPQTRGLSRRPVGRGLQRPRPVPGPGRPDRQRPARRGRRHRHLLEQAQPAAAPTSTARPRRP